jgi:hypothetical protein
VDSVIKQKAKSTNSRKIKRMLFRIVQDEKNEDVTMNISNTTDQVSADITNDPPFTMISTNL